jgi:hypothetical protein
MQYSAVLIIPAALKPEADAVGAVMGWGQKSYTIPLGSGESVTHYAARADVSEQFVRWVKGIDQLPDPAVQPVIDALIADFSPDPEDSEKLVHWGWAHLSAVILAHGLEATEPQPIVTNADSGV